MPDNFTTHEKNGVVYMTAPVITARHAFSTRFGGVSADGFASLNLGFGRGDARENVIENYRALGAALDMDVFSAGFTKQVHGTNVRVVADAGRASPTDPAPEECDGLVTNTPNLPIFCFTADCVPALLHDPENSVAAAVHCGWRSSVGDILGVAVEKMCALGAKPETICAAQGPAIGPCCFEIGPEVVEALDAYLDGDTDGLIFSGKAPGKYYADLRGANARRLIKLGLRKENLAVSDECTVCSHEKYWSHRYTRGGDRGSQCAVITL